MKRILTGILLSIATFLAGYLIVPQQNEQPTTIHQDRQNNNEVPSITGKVQEVIGESGEFSPEFRDLPNFQEIDRFAPESRLIDILERDGLYRESEVIAKSGERWLGLVQRGNKYSLVSTTAKVKRMRTISYPGDEYDVRLTFDKSGIPVFAVRNIPGLKAGPVTTVYHRPSWKEIDQRNLEIRPMETGPGRAFDLGDSRYILRVSTGLTKDGTKAAVLVLEYGNQLQIVRQTYHDSTMEKDIIGNLLWAGDLDGDGRLDLYFDEFNEKGYFAVELHLSSQAGPGEMVSLSATFVTAGC